MIQETVTKLEEVQQMTLAEAQTAIGSTVTVGELFMFFGAAAIGIVAWIVFNKYMAFRFGKPVDE